HLRPARAGQRSPRATAADRRAAPERPLPGCRPDRLAPRRGDFMKFAADKPAEERGLTRDGVRMLVATIDRLAHAKFSDLERFLTPGDLLVVNTSGTIAAAVDGHRADGRTVTVHFSTPLDGCWLVELRHGDDARGRVTDAEPAETIKLPGDAQLTLLSRYPGPAADPLWVTPTLGPGPA